MNNHIEQFRTTLLAAGLIPPKVIKPGRFHRFPGIDKKPGDDAGWCKLFEDGCGGVFGDFSSGLDGHWQVETERPNSEAERAAFRLRCESERQSREKQERQQHEAAAVKANAVLAAATGDPTGHPYAYKKRVSLGRLVKRGVWLQRGWDDALLIPIYGPNGHLWSLEAINPDGEKDFLKGGRKRGGFHPLGKIRGSARILICEGLATVAAVHAVDGSPAVAAMDAGNLEIVAQAIRKLSPNAELIILADNDIKTDGNNPGLTAAIKAAQAVSGHVIIPTLNGGKCDFWDVWHERGVDAVSHCLAQTQTQTIPTEAEINNCHTTANLGQLPERQEHGEHGERLFASVDGGKNKIATDANRENQLNNPVEKFSTWDYFQNHVPNVPDVPQLPESLEHGEHRERLFIAFDDRKNKIATDLNQDSQLSKTVEKFSIGYYFQNHIPDVPNVPVALNQATDEVIQSAIVDVEKVLKICMDQPGELFSSSFIAAVKTLRQNPKMWAAYRVKIRQSKPSGVLLSDIDDATRPAGTRDDGGEGIASELINLVTTHGELFFDDKANSSFVSVDIAGVNHTLAIGSKNFTEWLCYSYYQSTNTQQSPGRSASESAIKQACFALSGIAKQEGQQQPVFLRAATHKGGHYLFIGNDRLRVLEVLPTSWRILDKVPV
jgi:phage/plasmid primase-like uncharacterized protein